MMEDVKLEELILETESVIKELRQDIEDMGDFKLQSISAIIDDKRIYLDYIVNLYSTDNNFPVFKIIDDTIYEPMLASHLLVLLETQNCLAH